MIDTYDLYQRRRTRLQNLLMAAQGKKTAPKLQENLEQFVSHAIPGPGPRAPVSVERSTRHEPCFDKAGIPGRVPGMTMCVELRIDYHAHPSTPFLGPGSCVSQHRLQRLASKAPRNVVLCCSIA